MSTDDPTWAPPACTLPTAELPVRVAEFDALFATALCHVEVLGPAHARMRLSGPAGLAATVRDLVARETACCSFFAFTVEPAPDGAALTVDVRVPPGHADVLAALVRRAVAR